MTCIWQSVKYNFSQFNIFQMFKNVFNFEIQYFGKVNLSFFFLNCERLMTDIWTKTASQTKVETNGLSEQSDLWLLRDAQN